MTERESERQRERERRCERRETKGAIFSITSAIINNIILCT